MAAFERICSGIPDMDQALDNIRLGDNVVWRFSNLQEFRYFCEPYIEQAIKDNRRIVYFRFASHEPLVKECPQVERIEIPLSHRFEDFTVKIHKIIEKEGFDVFYVFDCLSELQTAWATDLMMGNFFRVTCPFLFTLDTVAFFPIIRGKHSFHAVKKILNTTQLLLDVYSDRRNTYVQKCGTEIRKPCFDHIFITEKQVHSVRSWMEYSPAVFIRFLTNFREQVKSSLQIPGIGFSTQQKCYMTII